MKRSQNGIAVNFTNVGASVRCSSRLDDQNPYVSTLHDKGNNNKLWNQNVMRRNMIIVRYNESRKKIHKILPDETDPGTKGATEGADKNRNKTQK